MLLRILLGLALLIGPAGSTAPRGELAHDAYIWQRQWTPALRAAVAGAADLVRAWRVLAMHSDRQGRLQAIAVDWPALVASGRPVVAVVRIQGQLHRLDEAALLASMDVQLAAWRMAGVGLAGVEIDHDCGTARLADYARFLGGLRDRLHPRGVPLAITALPAWLGAPALSAVLAPADEVVLQVHAVRDPRGGLFDAVEAERWIAELSRITAKPFRVALPTYGLRLALDEAQAVVAVEAERPLLASGAEPRELTAAPAEVAGLLRRLEQGRDRVAGIAWFRLPTVEDSRAWSATTWRAVIRGRPLDSTMAIERRPGALPGLQHIVLVNAGALDAELPRRIALPERCRLADGVGGYTLAEYGGGLELRRALLGHIPPGGERVVGWMRCGQGEVKLAIRP